MIAVIKGDIVSSRKVQDQNIWINPLKKLFDTWGKYPKDWELVWGDFFQIQLEDPAQALEKSLEIKALIKSIPQFDGPKTSSPIDVRMAIGIGEKSYQGERISESNGQAFVLAAAQFDRLKKQKTHLAINSPWEEFDKEINLYLKLSGIFMDTWSNSSAELVKILLSDRALTQEEIGMKLGIKQNSVSGRWNRAQVDSLFEVLEMYRQKIKRYLSC
ncbi:MAG: hypothetical protein HLUCCX10_11440 [Algoriphagus marincola HL-49]|uniref:SatD family (SatD) n=1 Tax=Algoriphagus marincola HL-49 TaxID=1305737 RepID=A0A0P8A882_9BACT|nr:MAG: hypothetical protein HLUCCX10_11440 [Algoriphagus marincola HL-49]